MDADRGEGPQVRSEGLRPRQAPQSSHADEHRCFWRFFLWRRCFWPRAYCARFRLSFLDGSQPERSFGRSVGDQVVHITRVCGSLLAPAQYQGRPIQGLRAPGGKASDAGGLVEASYGRERCGKLACRTSRTFMFPKCCRTLAQQLSAKQLLRGPSFGPNATRIGRRWPTTDQARPNLVVSGQIFADIGQHVNKQRPNLADLCQTLAVSGCNRPTFGQHLASFGRPRPSFCRLWPISANLGRIRTELVGNLSATLDNAGSSPGSPEAAFRDARRVIFCNFRVANFVLPSSGPTGPPS